MIQNIPLNKLVRSACNVRRSGSAEADAQLKADIEARGLLQNLVVMPTSKPRGSFAVIAGERRLRALQALAAEGKLAGKSDIGCLVVGGDPAQARETSLAENFQRLRMNPADECLAFQQMVTEGADPEGIARRFGLSLRFVEGRLRLADLAPVIFEALAAGEISLDVAKAYAVTPDRDRQAQLFEQIGRSYSGHHPDSIRRMMTQATASGSDRRALFVGEAAYLEAGGRIERDLFADDAAARWLDVVLLERLAAEKLAKTARHVQAEQGLAFVHPTLETWVGSSLTEGLQRLRLDPPPLTEGEAERLEQLEATLEQLSARLDDEELSEEERNQAEVEYSALREEITAIADRQPVLSDELRSRAGTFLLIDERGQANVYRDFFTERLQDDAMDGHPGAGSPADGDNESQTLTSKEPAISQRLTDELAMQRRDILAVHVAADPAFALDLAIFLMAERNSQRSHERRGSTLSAHAPSDPCHELAPTQASATIAELEADLDRSWLEGDSLAARFDAFRALSEEARASWLALTVSRTLEASVGSSAGPSCAFHDHLGKLLGIDVARWWRPTGTNFFDRVAKGVTLGALEEIGGSAFASGYSKAKKAELAQSCERIFAGNFIGEAGIKDAALSWVPPLMRFGAKTALDQAIADEQVGNRPGEQPQDATQCDGTPSPTDGRQAA